MLIWYNQCHFPPSFRERDNIQNHKNIKNIWVTVHEVTSNIYLIRVVISDDHLHARMMQKTATEDVSGITLT